MTTGEILEELRRDAGLTQQQVGDLLHVGNSAVSAYESNKAIPPAEALIILADYFNVSIDYLLGRTKLRIPWDAYTRPLLQENEACTVEAVVSDLLSAAPDDRAVVCAVLRLAVQKSKLESRLTLISDKPRRKRPKKESL